MPRLDYNELKRDAQAIKNLRARVDKATLKGRIARPATGVHTYANNRRLLPHARERRKWAMERQARHLHWLVRSSGSIDHDPRRADHSCLPRVSYDTFAFSRLRLVSWRTQCTWWTVPRRRVNNPERLMRVRRKAVAQHGLPFVRGKSTKSPESAYLFSYCLIIAMSLSRILTMSNVIAIYDIRKINLRDLML